MPVKWKPNLQGKTFASINTGKKEMRWPMEEQSSPETGKIQPPTQKTPIRTPVRTKVNKLEKLAGREVAGVGKVKLNQRKISQYLASTIGGVEEEAKVLGNKSPRQTSLPQGRCSPRRASLGAQREAGKAETPRPSPGTSGRVGGVP